MTIPERLASRLSAASPTVRFGLALLLVVLVALIDGVTGPLYAMSVFYLVPVALATSPGAAGYGYATSLAAALASMTGDMISDPLNVGVYAVNAAFRLVLFSVVVVLLVRLQGALGRERHLARIDSLTGLPNRRQFEESVERELRRSRRSSRVVALAYVDLDGFKGVNDTRGHSAGDAVLRATARILAANVRNSDVAARLGGDEFAVLFHDADDRPEATVERLREALSAGLREWNVTATIGTARSSPETTDLEELLQAADDAMYEAKRARAVGPGIRP